MKTSRIKVQYLFLLAGFLFLPLFFIYIFNFNTEIDTLYSRLITSQLVILEKTSKKPITLFFVGDVMLNRGVEYQILEKGNGDYKFPFLKIANHFKDTDILFGNLEGPLSDKGTKVGSIYSFRFNPKAVEGLVFAGFNIVSLANNHIFDYGREAMEDTFLRLRSFGIDYIGAGLNEKEAYSPVIKEIEDTKVAFLAYSKLGSEFWKAKDEMSGIAWLEEERMKEEIKKVKDLADIVIVSFHYGEEYSLESTFFQVSISQTAIDVGADLIIGHHPHVTQSIERYKNGYIAYSLGNFVFDQGFSEKTMKGLLLKVLIKDKQIRELIPIEIKINEFFQPEIEESL